MGGHINFCGRLELCVRTLFILSGDPELSGKLLQPTDQLSFETFLFVIQCQVFFVQTKCRPSVFLFQY